MGTESRLAEQEILQKLSNYLHERMGVNCDTLARSTDVAHDIGLTGDDAVEFLEWYERDFSIRKGSLNFIDHFDSEAGFWPFGIVIPFQRLLIPGCRKMPLTIDSLIELALESMTE